MKKGNHRGFPFTLLAESEAPFAEGEGFKPPIPEKGIPDFESSAIDHSANLPFLLAVAKVRIIFQSAKDFFLFLLKT